VSAFVHPTAEVDGAEVGEDSKIWHQAQLLAGASLGRECTVGKGAFLSSTATVGALVKIGNYATLMGARVESEVFPVQLRAFADLVLGRLDPADARAWASLSDGQYAVEVAARATQSLGG
jgi:hypothetical protein